jgi:hypothetical protein
MVAMYAMYGIASDPSAHAEEVEKINDKLIRKNSSNTYTNMIHRSTSEIGCDPIAFKGSEITNINKQHQEINKSGLSREKEKGTKQASNDTDTDNIFMDCDEISEDMIIYDTILDNGADHDVLNGKGIDKYHDVKGAGNIVIRGINGSSKVEKLASHQHVSGLDTKDGLVNDKSDLTCISLTSRMVYYFLASYRHHWVPHAAP